MPGFISGARGLWLCRAVSAKSSQRACCSGDSAELNTSLSVRATRISLASISCSRQLGCGLRPQDGAVVMGVLQTLVPLHLSLVRRSTENSTEDGLDESLRKQCVIVFPCAAPARIRVAQCAGAPEQTNKAGHVRRAKAPGNLLLPANARCGIDTRLLRGAV